MSAAEKSFQIKFLSKQQKFCLIINLFEVPMFHYPHGGLAELFRGPGGAWEALRNCLPFILSISGHDLHDAR